MNSKGAIRGQWGHCFLKLALDIIKLQMKSKKNVLGVFSGCLKTYTRFYRVADGEQKKIVLSNLVEGAMTFLIFLKGAVCKNV